MRRHELEAEGSLARVIAAQAVVFDDETTAVRFFGPNRFTTIRDTSRNVDWIVGSSDGRGPRRFVLDRQDDVSGVSGTGIVAQGALWADGTAIVRWLGEHPSTVQWGSMDDIEATHGHGGSTRVVWLDSEDGE